MSTKRSGVMVLLAMSVLLLIQTAYAGTGTGTLTGTFKYRNPTTGAETVLSSGYIYLHSATKAPPMEKFFTKADYVFGSTYGAPFSFSVPAGTYYIRLLQRKNVGGASAPYGPPQDGDYTWVQRTPITITAGQVTNLNTVYATPFLSAPITIVGTLKSRATGNPLVGYYVRAQTQPCLMDAPTVGVNQCGPDKNLAMQPTDANGKFTLYLNNPGTYYLYASACLTTDYIEITGNRCGVYDIMQINVKTGDVKTLNTSVWVGNGI